MEFQQLFFLGGGGGGRRGCRESGEEGVEKERKSKLRLAHREKAADPSRSKFLSALVGNSDQLLPFRMSSFPSFQCQIIHLLLFGIVNRANSIKTLSI